MKKRSFLLILFLLCIFIARPYSSSATIYHICLGTTSPPPCALTIPLSFPLGTWTSSDPAIVSVDPVTGALTTHGPGTVTITYTVLGSGCGDLIFSYILTVDPPPIIVSDPLVLCVGMNATLHANPVPPAGYWTSADPAIASIDAVTGLLEAWSPGVVTITYTNSSTGCFATTDVTVNAYPTPITGPTHVCPDGMIGLSSTPPGGTWSCTPASVATIDPLSGVLTGIDSNFASVLGATVTYTIPGGCYVTRTVKVYAKPVIVGPSAVCMGASITLVGRFAHGPLPPSVSGTWSSSDPLTASISSTGVVTGVVPGTAIITFTRPTGCFTTRVITVGTPFSVNICEIAPIETCDTAISYCNGLKLRVTGGAEGATYDWSPDIPATMTMDGTDAIFTFTGPPTTSVSAGAYTVTVTGPGGCTATDRVTIVVAPAGCAPCDHIRPCNTACEGCNVTPYFKTVMSGTITSADISPTIPGYYYIPQRVFTPGDPASHITTTTLNVNPANGSLMMMGHNVVLRIVDSITLDGIHLFSSTDCDWDGIDIVNTGATQGQLTITGNTLIEHATVAGVRVAASGTPAHLPAFGDVIHSDHAIYNLDEDGIFIGLFDLGSTDTIYPFNIRNSVFTARKFCSYHEGESFTPTNQYPFKWPSENYLKTAPGGEASGGYSPAYNIDIFPGMPNPSYDGIEIQMAGHTDSVSHPNYNYYGVIIGDKNNAGNNNLFDTLSVGSRIAGANVRFYNNVFRLSGAGVRGALQTAPYIGMKNSIELLYGTPAWTNNRFYNCYYGFQGVYWYNFISYRSLMSANRLPTASMMNNAIYNANDIFVNRYFGKHIMENNTIRNMYRGIYERVPSCLNPGSMVRIKGNTLTGLTDTATTEVGFAGIDVYELANCDTSGSTLDIDSNNISGYRDGIYVEGSASGVFCSMPTTITRNKVTLITRSYSDVETRAGIKCAHARYITTVTGNEVRGDITKAFAYNKPSYVTIPTEDSHVGIQLTRTSNSSSARVDLSCNYVHDVAAGFRFQGENSVDWRRNVMQRNSYGMLLHYLFGENGEIGAQGDTCNPSDNIWYDDGIALTGWPGWGSANTFQTYSWGSDPSFSKLYVRNVTTTPNIYNPTDHDREAGTVPVSIKYVNGTTVLTTTPGCTPSVNPCVNVPPTDTTGLGGGGGLGRPAPGPGRIKTDAPEGSATLGNYSIFPNPGDGNFTIRQDAITDMNVNVKVLNYAGAEVQKGTLNFRHGEGKVNIGKVANGMYMIVLTGETGESTVFRVVKQ